MDLKANKLSQLGYFLFYCPFMRGYCSSVDFEMGVRVHLREVAAYRWLKMCSFSREIVGTEFWCPHMGVVCLREVSVSGGLSVVDKTSQVNAENLATPLGLLEEQPGQYKTSLSGRERKDVLPAITWKSASRKSNGSHYAFP